MSPCEARPGISKAASGLSRAADRATHTSAGTFRFPLQVRGRAIEAAMRRRVLRYARLAWRSRDREARRRQESAYSRELHAPALPFVSLLRRTSGLAAPLPCSQLP